MSVFFKQGVLGTLQPVAQKGLGRVAGLYHKLNKELHVTSICEGNHGFGSFHYIRLAFDFRQDGVQLSTIKEVLGEGWDVLLSNNGAIHAEYDPKTTQSGKSPVPMKYP